MEINVKIVQVLQPQTFVRKDGTQVVRNSFVGETTSGHYDKKIKFDVLNQETWGKMNIRVGANFNVSFDVESREWNGKWFTSLNAWKAVCLDVQSQPSQASQNVAPAQQPNVAPQQPYSSRQDDGLPF